MITFYGHIKEQLLSVVFSPSAVIEVLDKSGDQLCILTRCSDLTECDFEGEVVVGGRAAEYLICLADVAFTLSFGSSFSLFYYDFCEGDTLHIRLDDFLGTTHKQWKGRKK